MNTLSNKNITVVGLALHNGEYKRDRHKGAESSLQLSACLNAFE
jgi:hypothetical protein